MLRSGHPSPGFRCYMPTPKRGFPAAPGRLASLSRTPRRLASSITFSQCGSCQDAAAIRMLMTLRAVHLPPRGVGTWRSLKALLRLG